MRAAVGDAPRDPAAAGGRGHAGSGGIPLETNAADPLHPLRLVPVGRARAVDAVLAEAHGSAGRVARRDQEGELRVGGVAVAAGEPGSGLPRSTLLIRHLPADATV